MRRSFGRVEQTSKAKGKVSCRRGGIEEERDMFCNTTMWYTSIAYYPVGIMPTGFLTSTGFLWAAPSF